jgi:sigma-B regulation protein RsbU (phosphoserine phosphatase)
LGWEFAGICKPAKAVGGDYYDIFEAVPGKVVVALGDVSGKGLGASFLMSSVHGSIRTRITSCINEPLKLIEELNAYLLSSTSKNIFVTLFFGIIDLETGKLSYVNCGHPPAILIRKGENQQERLTRNGPGLSMLAGAHFSQGECLLQNGDTVVIYSDGVTEAKNNQEEMYDEERLSELLNDVSELDATAMMNKILKSVDGFASGAEQADDISVIVVKRK